MNRDRQINREINPLTDLAYVLARILKRLAPSAVRRSSIHRTSKIEGGSQLVNCTFGRHSYCGYNCTFLNVEVGSFCSIADAVFVGGSGHPMHFVSTSPVFLSHRDSVKEKFSRFEYVNLPRTTIGSDVWVGRGASIRAGVSIGHGAIIAMGSVVTKDVLPYSVVGGNPARHIKFRFDEQLVSGLLETRWWELPDEKLRYWANWFNDPATFLDNWGQS